VIAEPAAAGRAAEEGEVEEGVGIGREVAVDVEVEVVEEGRDAGAGEAAVAGRDVKEPVAEEVVGVGRVGVEALLAGALLVETLPVGAGRPVIGEVAGEAGGVVFIGGAASFCGPLV